MDPIRAMFTELVQYEDVRRHLSGVVSHVDIRYPYAGEDTHPLVGRRMPRLDLTVAGGSTDTPQLLHPAQGVLLDLADDPALRAVAARWKSRVVPVGATVADPDSAAAAELAGATAVLIRPDGYVAWTAPGQESAAAALERWFGAPETGE
jgi:bifunctional hydroxylase/dehydrase